MSNPANTGNLYTGLNSQSFAKSREKRLEAKEAKNAQIQELVPKADLVLDELAKERLAIANEISNIIHIDMPIEDVKGTIMGLRLADQRLAALSNRLKNLLRTPKVELGDDDAEL